MRGTQVKSFKSFRSKGCCWWGGGVCVGYGGVWGGEAGNEEGRENQLGPPPHLSSVFPDTVCDVVAGMPSESDIEFRERIKNTGDNNEK